MSQMTPNAASPSAGRFRSGPNVYTVMMIVATLALLVGSGYVMYQSYKLFGSPLPPIHAASAGWISGPATGF